MALKLRRGTDSQRQLITPADGELVYATDTKKLFIGDGTTAGGNPVDTAGTELGSNLSLNNYNITGTGNINVDGNMTLTGNITADGNLTLGGNLTVGDANTDTLNLTAKIESHLLPDVDSARNVGSSVLRWGQGHFGSVHVTDDISAGSVNANIVGDDSTVIINKATGAINASGSFKGDINATDNSPFFNATSKAVTAGSGTFTGAVSAPSISAESIVGNFKGTIVGDDSTVLVDAVNSRLNLTNGELSIVGGVLKCTQSIFQISDTTENINTELHIYHGPGGNFSSQKFHSIGGNDALDPGGVAFRGYKGGFIGSGNETQLAAGDYLGQINAQSYDPVHNGGTSVLSSLISFRIDPDESVANDTFKGQIEFVNNSGTGSSVAPVYMTFDSSGRLGVNKQNPTSTLDVDGTAAFSSTVQFAAMTTVQRDALASVAQGMVIYNTTASKFQGRTGVAWVDLH
tara:strand:- start:14966 stop:16345 length:1380 start_codon:yes stop_codon:yes gene_type:complete